MDIKRKFGNNLKRLRLEKGLSQEKLALNADIDRTYIWKIEAYFMDGQKWKGVPDGKGGYNEFGSLMLIR